ncbi:hypothetical protein B0H17DRAFT_1098046 [Mycena rosella]|uniref:Uncharacterized protein n=1 Tax=Mycena rosella TaxID=1033263 RepID=A0AAD7G3V4_MYCRO|nr:hypothetical protein B0H17DRAFT_1098046 [Mycena rosella]
MDSEFSACPLPLYSPSHPSPCYSQDPAYDETRLDSSPQTATGVLPTGIFTKSYGSATVVLFDQESSVSVPSYGREASVRGSLILEQDMSHISEIVAKLDGRIEITTAESGALMINTVKKSYSLWFPGSSASSSCPERIDFACPLPTKFDHRGCECPLPPSYNAEFRGFPALFAKCIYSLTISIIKDRRRLGFLSKMKTIRVPVEYHPQTSPPRGISPTPTYFLSAVKVMPEEWHQSSFAMNTHCSSNLAPIQCQAFIPSVKIFGLSDTIPLHLQMSGPLSSLRTFILPSSPSPDDIDDGKGPVRVYLTRMVSFEYRGKATWRVMRLGEGRFRPLPPMVNFDCDCRPVCVPDDACVQSLDWDGEVKCDPGVAVGGFKSAGLTVKDFITLELIPPKPVSSPLLTMQHAIPIRLVTDTFLNVAT